MRKLCLVITILFITLVGAGCTKVRVKTPTIMPTIFQKQPVSQRPLIQGQFSGLPENPLITIYIRTTHGQETQWGTRLGNGPWESVIPNNPDIDYIITAEVEGYQSTPTSYSIHVEGTTAFLIENGQVTTNEALHLDFHFDSVGSTTPSK